MAAGSRSLDDLGHHFGATFYEREARFLVENEWATAAEDILQRRTKHGLHLTSREREDFESWFASLALETTS
jgi:glycerol-3-phosphate dehydrogenase